MSRIMFIGAGTVILILLGSMLYLTTTLKEPEEGKAFALKQNEEEKKAECVDNSVISCTTKEGCVGIKKCRNGVWSECIVVKKCLPGEKRACYINSCEMGYQICNECGTGFGECRKENLSIQ